MAKRNNRKVPLGYNPPPKDLGKISKGYNPKPQNLKPPEPTAKPPQK